MNKIRVIYNAIEEVIVFKYDAEDDYEDAIWNKRTKKKIPVD